MNRLPRNRPDMKNIDPSDNRYAAFRWVFPVWFRYIIDKETIHAGLGSYIKKLGQYGKIKGSESGIGQKPTLLTMTVNFSS
jgi:hypothetical protein